MNQIINEAIKWVVLHTKYSTYQVFTVIRLVDKYGDKTIYHLSKKQKEIYSFLVTAIEVEMYKKYMEEKNV